MLKKYTKFLDGLESVEKVFLVVTAAIMVIVIAYQVVLRYVFHASNAWSEELARYLFIYDVFIGSAIALRKNSHLQVDVFLNLMKERNIFIPLLLQSWGFCSWRYCLYIPFLCARSVPLILHLGFRFPWQFPMHVCL